MAYDSVVVLPIKYSRFDTSSGTKDMTGRMLLILPNRHQALLGRYTGAELTSLLQYYTHVAIYAGHHSGFTAVADLGTCTSRDVIIKLVETLERMQVRAKQLFQNCTTLLYSRLCSHAVETVRDMPFWSLCSRQNPWLFYDVTTLGFCYYSRDYSVNKSFNYKFKFFNKNFLLQVRLLQTGTRDGVHVFYALPPKNKDVLKVLKKMTGLKPSKKHPKIPVFEVGAF